MSITITEHHVHTSAPAYLKEDINWDVDYYTIAGLCTNGARFYSQSFTSLFKAKDEFEKYLAVVNYFGGGTVNLYCISTQGYDIIHSKKVF